MFIYGCFTIVLFCCAKAQWWDDCGKSKYEDAGTWPPPDTKIVGGDDVRMYEFPWQVSMRSTPGDNGFSQYCGGSIVHPRWVVTAAHCAIGENDGMLDAYIQSCVLDPFRDPGDVTIVAGEHDDMSPDSINPSRVRHQVMEIFLHEEYGGSRENYNNDIALLLLEEPIDFNENVTAVCQPRDIYFVNATAQISGWGSIGTLPSPDVLQYTEVYVTTNDECDKLLREINPTYGVNENMICAGDDTFHERDTCQGDSGGPMSVINDDGLFELIGITSWGYGCAAGTPGVYTRVTALSDWITAKIDKNTPSPETTTETPTI